MNSTQSSCEVAIAPAANAPHSPGLSRIHHFDPSFRWDGVSVAEYKQPAHSWCGIVRQVLVGERGEQTAFQVRYFEIAPGGFSSLESHAHEHAVFILRGSGEVQLGEAVHDLSFGDVVYVAPHAAHQFRNKGSEPFGFLCIVDAQRDRPTVAAV